MKTHAETKTHPPSRSPAMPTPNSLAHHEQYRQAMRRAGVQPRLEIGATGDALEREAEAAAERVVHMPEPLEGGVLSTGPNPLVGGHEPAHVLQLSEEPLGLSGGPPVCTNITLKRRDIRWSGILEKEVLGRPQHEDLYGHWWVEMKEDGKEESYGFWPKAPVATLAEVTSGVPGEVNARYFGGQAEKDPHHGDSADKAFHPKLKKEASGFKTPGDGALKCKQTAADFRNFAKNFPGRIWGYPGIFGKENCHTFQEQGMKKCGWEE
ncbi:MAG: hypothetical protein FWC28_01070 [Proteobacteria bacterium]|nr:hypothetical protein [Cystobacterineae bacterium]MCL2313831.1 hypothetical protein [Pseudomonadota bacterium]